MTGNKRLLSKKEKWLLAIYVWFFVLGTLVPGNYAIIFLMVAVASSVQLLRLSLDEYNRGKRK